MAVGRDKRRREGKREAGGRYGCVRQRREGSVRERKANQNPDLNQSPLI